MVDESKKVMRPRRRRTPETVRERANKQSTKKLHPKRHISTRIYRPFSVLNTIGKKEFHPIPIPKGRIGRILGKRLNIIPRFIIEAGQEMRLVVWPSPKDAARLTSAVVIFAFIFAIFVQLLGYGFDKLFKIILLK